MIQQQLAHLENIVFGFGSVEKTIEESETEQLRLKLAETENALTQLTEKLKKSEYRVRMLLRAIEKYESTVNN